MKLRSTSVPPLVLSWRRIREDGVALVVGRDEAGALRFVEFEKGRQIAALLAPWQKKWPEARFVRDPAPWRLPPVACLSGTAFQMAVWREIAKIPPGKTLSYGDLAERIGKPGASRAVGTACGANPVPYFVPCHRVLASGGQLGGFGGGIELKKKLLRAEGLDF